MPLTMGTATLRMTSDLVRWLHMMGSNPAMMAMAVIIRPYAFNGSFDDGRVDVIECHRAPFTRHDGTAFVQRVIGVDQHDHTRFCGHACQCNKADRRGGLNTYCAWVANAWENLAGYLCISERIIRSNVSDCANRARRGHGWSRCRYECRFPYY